MDDDLIGIVGIHHVVDRHTAEYALLEGSDNFLVVLDLGADESAESSAVLLRNDDIVGHIDKTTR